MFTHDEIWGAIDALAQAHNYSTSGLAKKAGLDPTTFNKSKRITADGKPRWPSTESITKSLNATDATLQDLVNLIENKPTASAKGKNALLEHYVLSSAGLDRRNQKNLSDITQLAKDSFAITIDSPQWAPTYKKGTTLIATPATVFTLETTVVIETIDKNILIMTVENEDSHSVSLRAIVLNEPDRRIEKSDILRASKILWASQ